MNDSIANAYNPAVTEHDLEAIYRDAIEVCAPDRLVARHLTEQHAAAGLRPPRVVVALGKCAAGMLDGAAEVLEVEAAFAAIPARYAMPHTTANVELAIGGHPTMNGASFAAGRALLAFVGAHHDADVLFLVSGGGSACVEAPLAPWFEEGELAAVNDCLIASGLSIGAMNIVRRHLSALKGGRLATLLRRSTTLLYSDVATGAIADVASGPTLADRSSNGDAARLLERLAGEEHARTIATLRDRRLPETVKQLGATHGAHVLADNGTLVDAAAARAQQLGYNVRRWNGQLDDDVATAAGMLMEAAGELREGELLVAGGEPTVVRQRSWQRSGRGGRCSELALRFAIEGTTRRDADRLSALFGSSDGVDGSSGTAGILLARGWHDRLDVEAARAALADSDSISVAAILGRPLIIQATGNNLRDLFLVARG